MNTLAMWPHGFNWAYGAEAPETNAGGGTIDIDVTFTAGTEQILMLASSLLQSNIRSVIVKGHIASHD